MKGIGYEMVEKIVRLGGSDHLWEDFFTLKGQKMCPISLSACA